MSFPIFGEVIEESKMSKEPFEEFGEIIERPGGVLPEKDILKQIPVSAIKGALPAYGNILESAGLQAKEVTPGRQSRFERQSKILEKIERGEKPTVGEVLMLGSEDVVAPDYGRLPTSKDVNKLFELLGIDPEAETPAGRIVGEGVESGAALAPFGVGGLWSLLSVAGGAVGQGAREIGAPEGVAATLDFLTSLSPAGKSIANIFKAAPKVIQKTPSGLTKLKGVTKPPKKVISVSERRFKKTSELLKKDFKKEIHRITDSKLPFSKISKGDTDVYSRFDNAFKIVRSEAKKIPGKKTGGINMFSSIDESIAKGMQIPHKSESTIGYLNKLHRFKRDLIYPRLHSKAGEFKRLSASQWEKQIREVNKGIGDISRIVDIKGDKAGKLKALREIRGLLEKSIETNYRKYPQFVKPFKALNSAFSQQKKYESVNKLFTPLFEQKEFSPAKIIKAIENPKNQKILNKALGKDGYKDLEKLTSDFSDINNLFDMLNVKKGDWKTFAKHTALHIPISVLGMLFPKGAVAVEAIYLTKLGIGKTKRIINNMVLSPEGRRNWANAKKAIKNKDKKGFFAATTALTAADYELDFNESID